MISRAKGAESRDGHAERQTGPRGVGDNDDLLSRDLPPLVLAAIQRPAPTHLCFAPRDGVLQPRRRHLQRADLRGMERDVAGFRHHPRQTSPYHP